jgi:hypothetical protein
MCLLREGRIMNNGMKVFWLVSIGAAFFLGYSVNSMINLNQNNTFSITEQPKLKYSDIQTKDNIQLKEIVKLEKLNAAVTVKPALNGLIDNLDHLLNKGQLSLDMASIVEAYKLIENLTEDELLTALNLMEGGLNKLKNLQVLSLLTERLASLDPLKAVQFVEDNVDSPQAKMTAMMSVISSWVKKDPISAYDWYKDQSNGYASNNNFSSMGLLSIFNGLAKHDINDAFTKLTELDSSGTNIVMAVMGISDVLESKEDFVQFIEHSDELDNLEITDAIIRSWALKSPLDTIEWSESMEGTEQQKTMQSTIFTTWVSTEPTSAADWYIGTASEGEKALHATEIIEMWSMIEPNEALTWLDQQTSFDTQESIVALLNSSTYDNVKFAIDNFERLTSDKNKADVSYRIYQSLERNSTKKAAEFLASSPYKQEIEQQQKNVEIREE